MDLHELFDSCVGFDWDDGNLEKNWDLHRVAFWEAEQVFFNHPLLVQHDPGHSQTEPRSFALGVTDAQRHLFVAFTIRRSRFRVVSARDMTRREVRAYGQHKA